MSDGLTAVIAIIGAATGVAGLVVQIVGVLRERSRLRLHVNVQTLLGKPPRLVIDILNDSPRATTVREVGLYARPVRIEIRPAGEQGGRPGVAEIDYPFNEHPFFMEAGATERFAGVPDIFTNGIHADQPLRVYATDARGRRVWGSAAPYFRLMIGDHPPIEHGDDESIKWSLRADGETRDPWPVEPAWKLWKQRELRRGSQEAREFRAAQNRAGGTLRVRGTVKYFEPDGVASVEVV